MKTISSRMMALSIKQSGATEIFLNGKLLKTYGEISQNAANTKAFTPVNQYLMAHLDSANTVLAIRYFFQSNINYSRHADIFYPLFLCHIFDANKLPNDLNKRKLILKGFDFGVFLILFLVFFIIFLFYKPNKANLFFSLWALVGCLNFFLNLHIHNETFIASQNQLTLWGSVIEKLINFFIVTTIYLLLNQQKKIILWSYLVVLILFFLVRLLGFNDTLILVINFVLYVLSISLGIYMGFNARRNRDKGGMFIIVGMSFFIIFWALFIFNVILGKNPLLGDILFRIALLSLPVSIAALLGLQNRDTNKKLLKQIDEIKVLSSEKQQILENQNETLEKQVAERTAELKASQNQLIQKEKLASLGELTAGIAHEIQNPLNFVNNFSELSVDIAKDLNAELQKTDIDKEYVSELLTDLSSNQEKINHHGKRASGIVKGMLEHSRASTGERAMTDINQLADEYLRLSYHGLRAKDKNFNADFKTELEENLPKINVVPQDIGRVLLNLINNAFYAVNERAQLSKGSQPLESYTPSVFVTTKHVDNQIIITVKDNGNGIPEKIREKIFQPFFTTKPTGQGNTGLGLSLSYDIVTKGHSGTLEVVSTEGVSTAFIIHLPL